MAVSHFLVTRISVITSSSPYYQKKKKLHASSVTVKATTDSSSSDNILDRRLFLSSSAAAVGTIGGNYAYGAPIKMPDISDSTYCQEASLPEGASPVNCCPPPHQRPIINFNFLSTAHLPMRTRPAAHLVDSAYISKYNRAYQLLKALPDDDPRKFSQQANAHCAYCDDAFLQSSPTSAPPDGTPPTIQIHDSWLFLPWHRWFLYFHERILGSLINDDTFALPFWNWDNQAISQPLPNAIPAMYLSNRGLKDNLRNQKHLPPVLVDLNYSGRETKASNRQLRAANNALMYQQIVSGAKTPSLFMGGAYRAGDLSTPGGGTLENAPHGPVHVWTGSSSQPNLEDMGSLYAAARDPIFFAHHANVDRIWNVWKRLGGRRRDLSDSDFLNAEFLFYDENSDLVRVKVSDSLSSGKLKYQYQHVEDAWVSARPSVVMGKSSARMTTTSLGVANAMTYSSAFQEMEEFVVRKTRKLEGIFRGRVKRPIKSVLEKFRKVIKGGDDDNDDVEEVLVIENIQVAADKPSKFDVFINLPEADEKTPTDVVEYCGTFVNVPHGHSSMQQDDVEEKKRVTTLRLGITDKLHQLGIKDVDEVQITLVSKGESTIVFYHVKIEYD